MSKNKFGIILIIFIISIFIFIAISDNENKKEEKSLKIEKEISETDKAIIKESYELVNNKEYSNIKKVNYNIAMFFKDLNNKNLDDIKLFPEYMDFLNLSSSEYLNYRYKVDDTLFYEILNIENMGEYNKTLVKIKCKYENKEGTSFKVFSLEDEFILDEPFLFVKDIGEAVDYKDIIFSVEGKAIFNDKAIYKIIIKNNGKETFFIDDDKYGFHAAQEKNKYYHTLEFGDITSYRVYPNTENELYVCFNNLRGEAGVYVKTKEKNILLTIQ